MHKESSLKVLFTGGGTGGHLFPAIALIEELKSRFKNMGSIEILFIGTKRGLESKILANSDYLFRTTWIRGYQRGLTFHDIITNLLFPLKLIVSFFQSLMILKTFKPQIAIGTGGYASGPPLYVSSLMKIPFFIHEQNVAPGVTTRLLAKHAEKIYTSFEDTKDYIDNTICYGIPIRPSLKTTAKNQALRFFDLNPDLTTVFIFGGSQGSHAINNYWIEHLESFLKIRDCQFIWQTGQRDYKNIKTLFGDNPLIHIIPFIHEMGIAYSAADIVISRSGALTLAELSLYKKPSILIPLPTAAGNHQEVNARILEKKGAAVVILQKDLQSNLLEKTLTSLINNNKQLLEMSEKVTALAKPDSARLIINDIMEFLQKYVWEN